MVTYLEIEKVLSQLAEADYREFIKALVYMETQIMDEQMLDGIYDKYIDNDDMALLNEALVIN